MTPVSAVQIGDQKVGASHPPLVLPDIDMFFNGDLSIASQLIDAVADAGLSTIKAAVLSDYDVVFDSPAEEPFLDQQGQPQATNYRDLIHKKVLSLDGHREVFSTVREKGLQLVVSVYDVVGVDFAVAEGVVALKIPSSNITHRVLIEAAAQTGLPLIIDTGRSTIGEIVRAVSWAQSAGEHSRIIVEHSPAAPPAPVERQDLSMIPFLRETLALNIGLSHHARGPLMLVAAVALGANLIEFGLCRDEEPADQDVYHALRVGELPAAVAQMTEVFEAMGDPRHLGRHSVDFHRARMSLRAQTSIREGDELSLHNVGFSFPPLGVGAERWPEVEGRTARRSLEAGEPITQADIS